VFVAGDVGDAARSSGCFAGLCAQTSHQHQLQGSAQLEHSDCQGRSVGRSVSRSVASGARWLASDLVAVYRPIFVTRNIFCT